MLEAMNQSVDPCDDFYDFACGRWSVKNIMPSNVASYGVLLKVRSDAVLKVKGLLETGEDEKEPEFVNKAMKMYKSCMNTSLIDERGVSPLLLLLHELGDWPVLDASWSESTYDVTALVAKVILLGQNALLASRVDTDLKDSNNRVLQLDQPTLGLPRDLFVDARFRSHLGAYRTFASDVASALGADRNVSVDDMNDMVDFEVSLAKITVPAAVRRNNIMALYNKFTIDELYVNVTDAIDWRRLFRLLFGEVNMTIDGSQSVVVFCPAFFKDLEQLLEITPKRTVANYILWKMVKVSVGHLSNAAFRDILDRYKRAMMGTSPKKPRWQTCVATTTNLFGMAVGRMFVDKYFDKTAKLAADEMIRDLRETFTSMLAEATWMDEHTRKLAYAKAKAIKEKIGYPKTIMDDVYMDRKFQEHRPHDNTYFENIMNTYTVAIKDNLKKLHKPVNKNKWQMSPAEVNAYYAVLENGIVFPAAILQPPLYSKTYPNYLNYGGIGNVIGHEITHGFDNTGRQFDLNGNLKQWWPKKVVDEFTRRAQCIVDQYSNYTVPEINLNINGKLTLGENIADNGGLKEGFRAYRKWVKRRGKEEDILPELGLDNNQLFFLSSAQVWCGETRPATSRRQLMTDVHSPYRFRVIGPLSNSEEFARAYKCPVGSNMNPAKKCGIW